MIILNALITLFADNGVPTPDASSSPFCCMAVIGQRLKLSGMRWTVAGADANLRCQQSGRPEDRIWPARHNQTFPA